MKKLVLIDSDYMDEYEIWAVEGYKLGDPAVRVRWGYATGSAGGVHNIADTYAIAEVGKVGKEGFEPVVWTDEDLGKGTKNRLVIGWPRDYEGWDPDGDIEEMDEWIKDYCQRML